MGEAPQHALTLLSALVWSRYFRRGNWLLFDIAPSLGGRLALMYVLLWTYFGPRFPLEGLSGKVRKKIQDEVTSCLGIEIGALARYLHD
jgi:hypothetical protein